MIQLVPSLRWAWYRVGLDAWARENVDRFDVLEIVDDCIGVTKSTRSAIFDLVGEIPLPAHDVTFDLARIFDEHRRHIQRHGISDYRSSFARLPRWVASPGSPLFTREAHGEDRCGASGDIPDIGRARPPWVREFADACLPIDNSRLENARQFHDFLCARWRREPVEPPYLRDVLVCELAYEKVRVGGAVEASAPVSAQHAPRDGIRRHPDVILLSCAYNIRAIFENASIEEVPVQRDTRLAIAIPPNAKHPGVFELLPVVFDLLRALEDWTDRLALRSVPESDEPIHELVHHGLNEVSG